jgi:hypothetical protein
MSFKKTLYKVQNSVVQFLCIRPDDLVFRLDAHLSKHHPFGRRELSVRTSLYVKKLRTIHVAFVQTSQQHVWTLFSVQQVK